MPAPQLLLLAATTSYRLADFCAAARADGVGLLVGTDRCHELAALFPEEAFGTIALDFRNLDAAVAAVVERSAGIVAVVPTDELTALLAARITTSLGLRGNSIDSALRTRSKAALRSALASRPQPRCTVIELDEDAAAAAARIGYPVVLKPLLLSASRGVIRADDDAQARAAQARIRALLSAPELKADPDPDAHRLLVESYVDGGEVAVEIILVAGEARILAVFDKPDPLVGPFFEETIYVTPSRLPHERLAAVEAEVRAAIAALGLREGPVHAEVRVPQQGSPVVLEVAARSIGGLCARSLRFGLGARSLESLVLDAALGHLPDVALAGASGVLMVPIPAAGVLLAMDGLDEARAVPGVEGVVQSAPLGSVLVPLPEGASYLAFVFARDREQSATGAARVERALRDAHAKLHYTIRPTL